MIILLYYISFIWFKYVKIYGTYGYYIEGKYQQKSLQLEEVMQLLQ